jgi:hypothetical protein
VTKIGYHKGPIRQKPRTRPSNQQIKAYLNRDQDQTRWKVNPSVALNRQGRLIVNIEGPPADVEHLLWYWRRKKEGEQDH